MWYVEKVVKQSPVGLGAKQYPSVRKINEAVLRSGTMPDCNRLAGGDAGTRHGSGRRDTSRTVGSDFSLNKEVKVFQFGARLFGPPDALSWAQVAMCPMRRHITHLCGE